MAKKIRLFIIECVDPMDLLQHRSEAQALEQVCKIIGHEVAIMTAYSKADFRKYCKYISSIDASHDEKSRRDIPLCIHISAHGNEKGIGFGGDFLEWSNLYKVMKPIFTELDYYDGNVFVAISACESGNQQLGSKIENEWKGSDKLVPPEYIFVTSEEGGVQWDDALVSWTVFYHKISSLSLNRKRKVQNILDKIKTLVGTDLRYFRWDTEKKRYLRYTGKTNN